MPDRLVAAQAPVSQPVTDPAPFAPEEPTDGREVGDWKSRYTDSRARRQMVCEALYLLAAITAAIAIIVAVALEFPRSSVGLTRDRWQALAPFAYAWAGGGLGGALFSAKWLIHTIGRGTWNQDRVAWRVFTPWLGAGAGLLVVLLAVSRVVPIFDPDLVGTGPGATGIALLVGFFADRTFSRLERFAAEHMHGGERTTGTERV